MVESIVWFQKQQERQRRNNDLIYGMKESQSYVLIFCNHIYNVSEFPCNSKMQLLPTSSSFKQQTLKTSFYELLDMVFYSEAICSERQCSLKTSHQFSPMNAFHRILLKQKLWNWKRFRNWLQITAMAEQLYILILALSSSEKARLNISF